MACNGTAPLRAGDAADADGGRIAQGRLDDAARHLDIGEYATRCTDAISIVGDARSVRGVFTPSGRDRHGRRRRPNIGLDTASISTSGPYIRVPSRERCSAVRRRAAATFRRARDANAAAANALRDAGSASRLAKLMHWVNLCHATQKERAARDAVPSGLLRLRYGHPQQRRIRAGESSTHVRARPLGYRHEPPRSRVFCVAGS
jgi:hypothetical protein